MPTEEIDEKDWDLEEWKQKYPMDYYKALRILSEASNGVVATEIFKAIYQITRLYINLNSKFLDIILVFEA